MCYLKNTHCQPACLHIHIYIYKHVHRYVGDGAGGSWDEYRVGDPIPVSKIALVFSVVGGEDVVVGGLCVIKIKHPTLFFGGGDACASPPLHTTKHAGPTHTPQQYNCGDYIGCAAIGTGPTGARWPYARAPALVRAFFFIGGGVGWVVVSSHSFKKSRSFNSKDRRCWSVGVCVRLLY